MATPLHLAAMKSGWSSDWSVIECLVGWGAALNLVDVDGNTPLHIVIQVKGAITPESSQLKQVCK